MTTYEVGTTAKFRGHYRERRQDGEWYDDIGCHMSAFGDDTARDLYTDITPPGPPLPAGTVLDPGKRYTLQSDPGDAIRILQSESGAWRDVTSYCIQWVVLDHEIVREIREPGSANQESRPEWDAVKIDVTRVADREPRYIYVSTEDIATTEAEADEARAECTRLNDGWNNAAELLSVANNEACELQTKLAESERLRKLHVVEVQDLRGEYSWWREQAFAEQRRSSAKQDQIRALEAKVLTRETALKAAQAEISRGLQNKIPKQRGYADRPYTSRSPSALDSLFSQFTVVDWRTPPEAPPVDETVAGYFTD